MGRVFKARDTRMNVPVALKVVRPDLAADQRFRKLFDLEVRIAARFSHPNIVPLHDLGELLDGTPFLGLALADGGSFGNFRRTVPSWAELLRLTLELLDALAHLHARGVLHRDLKPENILLYTGADGRPHVWLADLGLANASSALAKRKGRVEGTPGFMAPEQKLGLPREYAPWTDLYSLGVILWEAVTGVLPFDAGRSALDAELPALMPQASMKVPSGLDIILSNLLSGEPLCRYDLAADLRTELEALGPATLDAASIQANPGTVRLGTVAPSAPPPTSASPGLASPTPSFSAPISKVSRSNPTMALGSESPPLDAAPAELAAAYGVPVWNRPRPKPMPIQPVPERGMGATARASLPLFALREIPLVARDSFRRVIWDMARAVARDGRSRVALVIGEAGTGKTKLVESVARTLEEGGWAECVTLSWQRPPTADDGYAGAAKNLVKPWNETRPTLEHRMRRRLARERGAIDPAIFEESAMVARWCGLSNEGEAPVADGIGLREIHRHLEARSWRGLSVAMLDDVQWAVEEGDGLQIAEAVLQAAQEGADRRLLVLATIRSEDLANDPQLAAKVEHLVALGGRRLDLPRLDRKSTEALLRECLTLTTDLQKRVAERCEGNPLFARQLLLEWADRGWLVEKGDLQFGLAPGVDADAVLPADAEALFHERVAALAAASGDTARFLDILHALALIGATVPVALLPLLTEPDLAVFVRGCGLWLAKGDTLKFDHGLLHQSVRTTAEARADVASLQRRIADAWDRYGNETGTDVDTEVGRHAHAAEDWPRAVSALLRAAATAWNTGKTKSLDDLTRLALDATGRDPSLSTEVGDAHLWRARSWQARGVVSEAAEQFLRSRTACDQSGNAARSVEATIGMAWASRQTGDLAEAQSLYQDAMRRAKQLKEVRLEATAIAGLAWVEQQKRNFEGADILFTRVLNRCTQLGDGRGAAEAALGQATVARRRGEFDEAEELYAEAATAFQEADDLLGVARANHGRGMVLRQRLQVDAAERVFRDTLGIAEDLGVTDLLMDCRYALAEVYRLRGDRERARRAYEAHVRWAAREQQFEEEILGWLGLAQVAVLDGDQAALYQNAVKAAEILNRVPAHWLWAPYRLLVAVLLAQRGEEDQCYRWLWSAAELGLADIVDHDIAHLLTIICHTAHARRWQNVMKVASKLATGQWDRLKLADPSREVTQLANEILGA